MQIPGHGSLLQQVFTIARAPGPETLAANERVGVVEWAALRAGVPCPADSFKLEIGLSKCKPCSPGTSCAPLPPPILLPRETLTPPPSTLLQVRRGWASIPASGVLGGS